MNILITWARSYVARSMMKLSSFQEDITLFLGDTHAYWLWFRSKIPHQKVIFPSPQNNFQCFKKYIIECTRKFSIERIYPTCEEVFYFAMIRQELQVLWCEVVASDIDTLNLLHSKYACMKYLTTLNLSCIQVPETHHSTNTAQLHSFLNASNQKVIIKHEYSRFASKIYTNFKSDYFLSSDECVVTESNPVVIQSYISWSPLCCFAWYHHGVLSTHITYKNILTYKWWAGTAIEHANKPAIEEFLILIWKDLWLHGPISFDFIENDQLISVIECNPRVTSGIHLYDEDESLSTSIFQKPMKVSLSWNKYKSFVITNILYNRKYFFKLPQAFSRKNEVVTNDIWVFFYQYYVLIWYLIQSLMLDKSILELLVQDIAYNWPTRI